MTGQVNSFPSEVKYYNRWGSKEFTLGNKKKQLPPQEEKNPLHAPSHLFSKMSRSQDGHVNKQNGEVNKSYGDQKNLKLRK